MTTALDLENMSTICEARYAQRQQDFAKLVAEENRLRSELLKLDAMGRSAEATDSQASNMRAIGADVIWHGWLCRNKTALNQDLSRVLAVKERHLREVRHAYGKVLVVKEMQSAQRAKARKSAADSALAQAIDLTVIR